MANRRVQVDFYRARRASRSGDDWTWPADGDVAMVLSEALTKERDRRVPLVTHYGRTFLIEEHSSAPPRQFGASTVRSDNLPLVLRAGASTGEPLPLGERDNLLEPTYLTFFGSRVVAVVKGSRQTPGHRAAAGALAKLTQVDLELIPIPRSDVVAMIQRGEGVATFDFAVAGGSIDVATETNDYVKAAGELKNRVRSAHTVRVTLNAETASQKRGLRADVLSMLRRRGTEGFESAHAGILSKDAAYEVIDLLEADVSVGITIDAQPKTRHLLPDDAQSAAEQAFASLRTIISTSIANSLDDNGEGHLE
jgi:hypothetical protein